MICFSFLLIRYFVYFLGYSTLCLLMIIIHLYLVFNSNDPISSVFEKVEYVTF